MRAPSDVTNAYRGVRERVVALARAADGLRLETDHGSFAGGGGAAPEVTVRASRFELFRAITGRRSLGQIRAYDWAPAPRPEAVVLSLFIARQTPLVE